MKLRKVGVETRLMDHLDEMNRLFESKEDVEKELAWVNEDFVIIERE